MKDVFLQLLLLLLFGPKFTVFGELLTSRERVIMEDEGEEVSSWLLLHLQATGSNDTEQVSAAIISQPNEFNHVLSSDLESRVPDLYNVTVNSLSFTPTFLVNVSVWPPTTGLSALKSVAADNSSIVEFQGEMYDIVSVLARHELLVPQKLQHSYSQFENFTLLVIVAAVLLLCLSFFVCSLLHIHKRSSQPNKNHNDQSLRAPFLVQDDFNDKNDFIDDSFDKVSDFSDKVISDMMKPGPLEYSNVEEIPSKIVFQRRPEADHSLSESRPVSANGQFYSDSRSQSANSHLVVIDDLREDVNDPDDRPGTANGQHSRPGTANGHQPPVNVSPFMFVPRPSSIANSRTSLQSRPPSRMSEHRSTPLPLPSSHSNLRTRSLPKKRKKPAPPPRVDSLPRHPHSRRSRPLSVPAPCHIQGYTDRPMSADFLHQVLPRESIDRDVRAILSELATVQDEE